MDLKGLFSINRRMLIATVIGAALFTILSRYVYLPTPVKGILFFPSYGLLGLFAALFGPISGAFISLSGMVIVGILVDSIFPGFIIASAICGFIYGLCKTRVRAGEGKFGYNEIISYNIAQIGGNVFAWGLAAPVLELILSPGRPAPEVFMQGIIAALVDIISAEFIGTPLLYGYSLIRRKQLKKRENSNSTRL